jgi:hypothetical protein
MGARERVARQHVAASLLTLARHVPVTFGLSVVLLLVTGALLTRVVRSVVKYTVVVLLLVAAYRDPDCDRPLSTMPPEPPGTGPIPVHSIPVHPTE